MSAMSGFAGTWFTYTFSYSDGTPNTNYAVVTAYPAQTYTFTAVGSNVVYGGAAHTNLIQPNSSGQGASQLIAGNYQFFFPSLNYGFTAGIPVSSATNDLSAYIGVPIIFQANSLYAFVTNSLGYAPATNTYSGLISAFGFNPATNGGSVAYSQLPWTPPTNSYYGITNALGFAPFTNAAPLTNTATFVSSVSTTTNSSGCVTNVQTAFSTNTIIYIP